MCARIVACGPIINILQMRGALPIRRLRDTRLNLERSTVHVLNLDMHLRSHKTFGHKIIHLGLYMETKGKHFCTSFEACCTDLR